jgi:methyltransferase-like protein/cyclopropane fatty-acyl-phospholipid synthase-like methyltransferase
LPFVDTHPDRLAAVATLFGLKPRSVETCRVLELGCAGGGNLTPMAVGLPGSQFLGIDLSPRQIADGQEIIRALALTNIELRTADILAIDASWGPFDFIICHGVYSWVPAAVQDKILSICVENLAADGVALVSYNTFPGWHERRAARDLMGYFVSSQADSSVRAQQARAFLDFLARSAATRPDSAYRRALAETAEQVRSKSDSYLLHEYLEDVNEPLYFFQFIDRIKAKGLQYLADARVSILGTSHLPAEVVQTLNQVAPTLIQREQMLDFLNNQGFRRSLLCRPHSSLNRALKAETLTAFHIASLAQPATEQPDIHSSAVERFVSPDGLELATPDPLLKTALVYLAEVSPWAVSFADLVVTVRQRLRLASSATEQARDARILGARLLNCYMSGLIELTVRPPSFRLEVSTKPEASPFARWQTATTDRLTNLRHEVVHVTAFARRLLPLLNGTHDREALIDALVTSSPGHASPPEPAERATIGTALDETLELLARSAFLRG